MTPSLAGITTAERERLKELERENRQLRQANEIRRKASAYFAQAERDRRLKCWSASIAQTIAGRDTASEAPGRIDFPEDASVRLMGAWRTGLSAMRRALFSSVVEVRDDPVWVAADGYAGTAIGFGETRDEAVENCRSEVEILTPSPPEPKPMPELTPELIEEMGIGDVQIISSPAEDRPRLPATPRNTPIALTRVTPVPIQEGRVVLLLDDRGRSYGATVLENEDGLTIIGHGVIERVDLEHLGTRIDEAISVRRERLGSERPWPSRLPPLRSRTWQLELLADGSLQARASSASPEFLPGTLDGARIHARIMRQVRCP